MGRLYKGRCQLELLFRWIKQHLKMRKLLGHNDNAIGLPILRFTDLVSRCLFQRQTIAAIDKPPVDPNRPRARTTPNQMTFFYA